MRIAFIVQPDWLKEHFGVRNLFISCAKIFEKYGHIVDFVTFYLNSTEILYYRQIVSDSDLKSNISDTTIGTKKRYKILVNKIQNIPECKVQFLGNSIDDLYDAIVFTNPWLIDIPIVFSSQKPKALICYDCVANKLALTGSDNSFDWAFMHNVGYKYAIDNNINLMSISKKTDEEIVKYYKPKKHCFLPPIPTYAFLDVDYSLNQRKENAIVLAAPFDVRKGVKYIPKILNALENNFETLYIYGTPRCGETLYNNFYKELKIKNVIHYDNISSNDLIDLYKKCKILLFPSLEEGLGMPIIEAQLCGCRVVTTNKAPMNELLCDGNYLLTANFEKNISNIKNMLNENNFDYTNLANNAKMKFSLENIYKEMFYALKIDWTNEQ